MIELPFKDFVDRVFTTSERVKFADADPYGHLSSGAYVDLILGRRVQAVGDVAGLDFIRMAARGIGFPVRAFRIDYRRPSFVGDRLRIASWLEELTADRFHVRAVVTGEEDGSMRAEALVTFAAVDMRTGRSIPLPETLESGLDRDPLPELPTSAGYLVSIAGTPAA